MNRELHEDVVARLMGETDPDRENGITRALDRDPEARAEADAIGRHLLLHDSVPELSPGPAVWTRLRARLDEPAPGAAGSSPRPGPARLWMPLAAAALVAAAFLWPEFRAGPADAAPALAPLFGDSVEVGPDRWEARGVSRFRLGDDTYLTLDAGSRLHARSATRLDLEAGRVFCEVRPGGTGLAVACRGARVTTLGTHFLVEAAGDAGDLRVIAERGRVRVEHDGRTAIVGPGEPWASGPLPPPPAGYATAWFSLPTLTATLTSPTTLDVVIRNEMPDPIELAPPTGGEPFFFALYDGHQHHLTVDLRAPVRLAPGATRRFSLDLPRPVPAGAPVVVTAKKLGLQAEAAR